MSPQLKSLIRKEWHERRTSLGLATAWIVLGTIYTLGYEIAFRVRGPVGSFYSTCMVYGLFVPVFLAMRTALGERTQRTIGFSAALPVTLGKQAAVRLGGGVATLALPIVLGAAIVSAVLATGAIEESPQRPTRDGLPYIDFAHRPSLSGMEAAGLTWRCAAIASASSIELLLILSVIGCRRRHETHVGFIGAAAAFAWLAGGMSFQDAFRSNAYRETGNWLAALLPQSLVVLHSYNMPEGSYNDLAIADRVWGPLLVNSLVLVGLGAWFIHRYRAVLPWANERTAWARVRLPALVSRLPVRFHGQTLALAWLDLRQSVPLALAGLALAFFMTLADIYLSPGSWSVWAANRNASAAAIACGRLPGATWVVAIFWSAVVGSGIFAAELEPGLATFWRSRPINPAGWFWTKFAVGLVAVLAVLDGTTIAVSWNSPYGATPNRMSWSYVVCMPLLHGTFYCLAVFGVCRLRRPVLGAMCAIALFFLVELVLQSIPRMDSYEPISVYNGLFYAETRSAGVIGLSGEHYPLVYGIILLAGILAAVAASRAIRAPSPNRAA